MAITGTRVDPEANGPSCVTVTTDSEGHRISRQGSDVGAIELRTHVFIDSLQPQLAAYMGTVSQGFLPIPGDACLWLEVSPGMAVHRVTDIALKASTVRLGQMVVERAFGSLALYHRDQSTVLHSGQVVLEAIGSRIEQRSPCTVTWTEIIRAITPDHAVLINRQNRRGSMIQAGMSMFILETEPAGYVLIAANEAEKASNITVVDVKAVGAFGRLTLAGREGMWRRLLPPPCGRWPVSTAPLKPQTIAACAERSGAWPCRGCPVCCADVGSSLRRCKRPHAPRKCCRSQRFGLGLQQNFAAANAFGSSSICPSGLATATALWKLALR